MPGQSLPRFVSQDREELEQESDTESTLLGEGQMTWRGRDLQRYSSTSSEERLFLSRVRPFHAVHALNQAIYICMISALETKRIPAA